MPYQVPTAGIEDSAINSNKIATDAVGTSEIITDGVRTVDIQNSAVTTAKINNDAVTYGKIQNVVTANRVLGSTSANGIVSEVQVQTAMIANDAVTNAKVAANAVDTEQVVDEAITMAKLSPDIEFFPVGGIVMWSGSASAPPSGWQLCDGGAITTGDLAGTNTPDLRSRFIVGASTSGSGVTFNVTTGATSGAYGVGNTGGEVAHKLTIDELAVHDHTYSRNGGASDYGGSNPASGSPQPEGTTGSRGSGHYHENRPPYYALAFIMKL